MSSTWIILVFLFSIVFLLVTIIKFKMNAFFSMILAALSVGVLLRMPMPTVVDIIGKGFGGMASSLGIVCTFGALLGGFLSASGATKKLADGILKFAGEKHSTLAMNIVGYIISIPVYMGSAYVILDPLNKSLAHRTKRNVIAYSTSLAIGLLVTHCLVIPTPGPLAVAAALKLNVGWFIFYALIVSVPACLIGGWLYGEFLGKKFPYDSERDLEEDPEDDNERPMPSVGLSLSLIAMPIVLIVLGTVLPLAIKNPSVVQVCATLTGGNGFLSLLISVALSMLFLHKYIDISFTEVMNQSLGSMGEMFLILGAGGSLGAVINASGIGERLVGILTGLHISVLVVAFVLCISLRAALGSSTVALVTTATILGPVASQMGVNMVLMGLTICAAAIGLSLPTDGGFWMIMKFDKLSFKETLYTMTGGSTIASLVAFGAILILSACSAFLPGLA